MSLIGTDNMIVKTFAFVDVYLSIWTSYISDINVLFLSVFKLNLHHIKVG